MDQDATWYGGRPWPWPHCVRWGPTPLPKGHSPQFLAHVCCGQTAGWIKMPLGMEVDLGPGDIVLGGDPVPPKGHSPQFLAHVYCSQMAGCIRIPLCVRRNCVRWGPCSPLKGPLFGPCLLWPNGRPSQLLLSLSVMISCCRLNWLPSFLIYIMHSVLYSAFSYCSGLPPGVDTVYVEIFDEVCILSVFIVLSSVLVESYCVLSYQ